MSVSSQLFRSNKTIHASRDPRASLKPLKSVQPHPAPGHPRLAVVFLCRALASAPGWPELRLHCGHLRTCVLMCICFCFNLPPLFLSFFIYPPPPPPFSFLPSPTGIHLSTPHLLFLLPHQAPLPFFCTPRSLSTSSLSFLHPPFFLYPPTSPCPPTGTFRTCAG